MRALVLTCSLLAACSTWHLTAPPAFAQSARSASAPAADPLEGFDAYVAQAVADWRAPGLAIAVVKDGQVRFAKGYGVRELGKADKVDTRTLFAVGSTTKAMTAAAVGMLVDAGKVKWDDRVIDHLPSFRLSDPYVTREVTVRDLLTHRAGLGNTDYLWYGANASTADIVGRLRLAEPESSLRSHFTYQNVMYAAAGELIAAVSGQPWDRFIQARIFTPLGMRASIPTAATLDRQPDVASPHFAIDGTVRVIRNASVDAVASAGAVWSNVEDMSRWLRVLLNGCRTDGLGDVPAIALLKPETCAELFTPQTMVGPDGFYPTARLTKPHWTTYGLGWFQQDYAGRALDYHTGSIDGMVAIAGLVRDEGLGLIVLSNLDHAEVRHALMYRVFDAFAPASSRATPTGVSRTAGTEAANGTNGAGAGAPRDWSRDLLAFYGNLAKEGAAAQQKIDAARVAGTMPSLAIDRYAGTYSHPLYGTVVVSTVPAGTSAATSASTSAATATPTATAMTTTAAPTATGTLRVTYGTGFDGMLEHWHYDTFRARWSSAWLGTSLVTFTLDAGGAPATVELNGLRFTRAK